LADPDGDRDCSVLVVDDDFMVARIHRGFVDRLDGFTVAGEAHTGAEALAAVERLRPDIVLLDVYLPDIGGLEVLEQLRTGRHADTDVIVVTAARDVETVSRSLQLGARQYLIKPFGKRDLHDRLLQVRRLREELATRGEEAVRQHEVDRFFGTTPVSAPANRLPKGLSAVTMESVVARLRELTEPCSATSLGEDVGLSRVSARRYLDHLVKIGVVRVELRYGDVGRPEHLYRWARA
jgi:two-component system CitB family response regulator